MTRKHVDRKKEAFEAKRSALSETNVKFIVAAAAAARQPHPAVVNFRIIDHGHAKR